MKLITCSSVSRVALAAIMLCQCASAVLIQHNNYMIDDSDMIGHHEGGASFAPFAYDRGVERSADSDVIKAIEGDRFGRTYFAKMLQDQQDQQDEPSGQLNSDLAELFAASQQQDQKLAPEGAAESKQEQPAGDARDTGSVSSDLISLLSGGGSGAAAGSSIAELDTSSVLSGPSGGASSSAQPSKMELKAPGQWFNPKEIIPVLKISSMATPSKYKKVYFRSEKKLVDGAFHAQTPEPEKKSMLKQFNSGVQRRSSKASAAGGSPQGLFQDGVIEFLRKFRDVYVQTRPATPTKNNLASTVMSAAASSPIVSMLLPPSSGSASSGGAGKPNFANALSAASSMINGAAMLAQASSAAASPSSSSSSSSAQGSGAAASPAAAGAAGAAVAGSAGNKRPGVVNGQTYVQFWSKTFPDWVRKMLKQLRRRSLYNSSKRQQHQHSAANSIGQATQASAGAASANSMVERTSSNGSGQSAA